MNPPKPDSPKSSQLCLCPACLIPAALIVGMLGFAAVTKAAPANPPERCATSLKDLAQILGVSQRVWTETTADDGKPMVLRLTEANNQIHLEFDKTKDGLWASGPAKVCASAGRVTAAIPKSDIKVGEAAPWVARLGLSRGATFTLVRKEKDQLDVSTTGWRGTFIPR